VLIPEENAKDLAEIPDNVKNGMEIIPVSRMGEVIKHALIRQPIPIEWDGSIETPLIATVEGVDDFGNAIAH
jgi:ATP-dependent Lon protease